MHEDMSLQYLCLWRIDKKLAIVEVCKHFSPNFSCVAILRAAHLGGHSTTTTTRRQPHECSHLQALAHTVFVSGKFQSHVPIASPKLKRKWKRKRFVVPPEVPAALATQRVRRDCLKAAVAMAARPCPSNSAASQLLLNFPCTEIKLMCDTKTKCRFRKQIEQESKSSRKRREAYPLCVASIPPAVPRFQTSYPLVW